MWHRLPLSEEGNRQKVSQDRKRGRSFFDLCSIKENLLHLQKLIADTLALHRSKQIPGKKLFSEVSFYFQQIPRQI